MEKKQLNIFERNAKFIVIFAVVAGATSGIFGKLTEAPSMVIGFYRLLFALPFFLVPILLKHRGEFKNIGRREWVLSIVSGIALFLHYWSWFTALKITSVASATVLVTLHPFLVAAMGFLIWKKPVSLKAVLGIVVAIIGGTIVVGGNFTDGNTFFGDILAFAACIGMGIYLSIGSEVRSKMSASVYILIVFGTCLLCFSIAIVITSTPLLTYEPKDYFWIAVMAIVCQLGCHAVFNWSMGYVSSLYVSALDTGEIIVAALLALIVFSEIPTVWQMLGGIIVILGLLYYNYHEGDKN